MHLLFCAALNEFELSRNEVIGVDVDLKDADGMSLIMNDIWQYKTCSKFHVRIVLNVSRKKIELIVEVCKVGSIFSQIRKNLVESVEFQSHILV